MFFISYPFFSIFYFSNFLEVHKDSLVLCLKRVLFMYLSRNKRCQDCFGLLAQSFVPSNIFDFCFWIFPCFESFQLDSFSLIIYLVISVMLFVRRHILLSFSPFIHLSIPFKPSPVCFVWLCWSTTTDSSVLVDW